MSRQLEALKLQVSRIAETSAEPPLARALLSFLEGLDTFPQELRMLSVELSDLEPEPEECQNRSCDEWAVSGDYFCIYHL